MGFGHSLSVKNHTIDKNCEGGDFKIKADRDKIEQVIINLLDNSLNKKKHAGKYIIIEIHFFLC